jgi:hypothetical protein
MPRSRPFPEVPRAATFNHFASIVRYHSQVYSVEQDETRRDELRQFLEKAVAFSAVAQATCGGWGYVAAKDGADFDEGNATQCQVQALQAVRQAGILVPKDVLVKSANYVRKATVISKNSDNPQRVEAGLTYSVASGGAGAPRPIITTCALASALHAGQANETMHVQWLNLCHSSFPGIGDEKRRNANLDSYQDLWLALVIYSLGEDGHARLRPDLAKEEDQTGKPVLLKWSRVRAEAFERLTAQQREDASWQTGMSPVMDTSLRLIVMQLERNSVPWFRP